MMLYSGALYRYVLFLDFKKIFLHLSDVNIPEIMIFFIISNELFLYYIQYKLFYQQVFCNKIHYYTLCMGPNTIPGKLVKQIVFNKGFISMFLT